MKKLLLLFVLMSGTLRAQQITLSGTVSSLKAGPVLGANIGLYLTADSSLVKATITNQSGKFSISTNRGNYYVAVKALGFISYRSATIELITNKELGPIALKNSIKELNAVTISTHQQLIEVLPDKTVFNVQNSLVATGLTGFDVLRKAPGVMIDNQDNLIVEGKTGVGIYIDGKVSPLAGQDLTTYLKTLQATDIEAIEIITQPSSKYDAAGSAGIINIRLKKNKNYGTNGSVTTGYAIGQYGKYTNSISLNNRTANVNLFGTYSNNIGKNESYLNLDRFQSGFEYNQQGTTVSNDHSHNVRLGMDLTSGKYSTVGILLNGNFSGYNSTNTSNTPISSLATNQTQQVLLASNFTDNSNNNLTANLNYRFANQKGDELTLDGDYGYYKAGRNSLQPNYYFDGSGTVLQSQVEYRMITPVDIHLLSLKADVGRKLWNGKFAAGLKLSSVKTGNSFNFYDVSGTVETYNSNQSNYFSYTETIAAAYINYSKNWKKLSLQAGVRAEQTTSDGELLSSQQTQNGSVNRSYLNVFPSGGLTYTVDPKNSLALTYSRRIQRPDYRSLNPFEYYINELSLSKGNPFLKPQYTDAVKLSHTYNYTLTTSVTYSYIRNFFAQITDTLNHNQNFISPQNIANQQVISFEVSYPFSVFKWWSVYTNASAYKSIYQATNNKFMGINQNTLSFYGQNTFSLPAAYSLEVSGWFSSPSIWAGTYHTRSLGSLDLGLQKLFFSKKLSARLALSDVLKTSNWSGTTQYGQLYINGSGGYESRQLRISLSYNFGRKEIKAAERRKSAVDDEKGRIGN